jgi:hypothetical protein
MIGEEILPIVHPKFRGLIERALAEGYGQMGYEDVLKGVRDGVYQLWAAEGSLCITTIDIFPLIKQCTVIIGAGDLREIDDELRPMIEKWARSIGCDTMLIMGRPGWERALEGYRRTAVVLEKKL